MAALQQRAVRPDALYIGGRWCRAIGDARIAVESPATRETLGQIALAGAQDIDTAVESARLAFDRGPWPAMEPHERARVLARLSDAVDEHADVFELLLAEEVGTPISSLGQSAMCTQLLRHHVALASSYPWTEHRRGLEGELELRRVPVGVVAAIVPWNVPLFLAMAKLAPALLAGCTVVLKPAEETPLHALLLAALVDGLGLPDGVLNVVPADREVSELLVRHPGVDKVSFTGSTAAGRQIAAICGEQLKRCSLELGGKSAAVVLADARVDTVIPALAPLTMLNNGQMCANQTRVLAPSHRYDEIVDALAQEIARFVVGDPRDERTQVGPLVSARQRERVEGYIASGRAHGARLVTGGGRPAGLPGYYVEPTVFADVDNAMPIAREEIFGPVVTVLRYRDEAEAVAIANDSPYGLSGSVWSSDAEHARVVARQLRTGNVGLNTVLLDLAAPFGGFKDSGIGRECGPEGVDQFVELQAIEHERVVHTGPDTARVKGSS